ncbi:Myosin-binding protein 7 [Heracleum sosnowskyi]|uniref:Myosin-binding protein 7 n=1 Tax=Heracleum sosnowskyi TaxID=360622 RepID=A0AAD8IHT8_9APIA|nr:Myosin-binding protein 7 [Heracleum sosnowskyi]
MSMDSEHDMPLSISRVECCDCECACVTTKRSNSGAWLRKLGAFEVEEGGFEIPGLDTAKVQLVDECVLLREMVTRQKQRIDDLSVELEEERNASASSASEAMSMILRLQREKAEVQMEFRQYKRVVEEKIVHDGEEILALEDLLYKREQIIKSLTCEMESYKHRMMSYGLTEVETEGEVVRSRNNSKDYWEAQHDTFTYDYPSTECSSYENQFSNDEVNSDVVEVEKHVFRELPQPRGQIEDLEYRTKQLEESQPDVEIFGTKNVLEKVEGSHSPRYRHGRKSSTDSSSSIYASVKESTDVAYDLGRAKEKECVHVHSEKKSNLEMVDTELEVGDDMSERVHTLEDIKKLYMKLQALEADRESMRQALISVGTEKAQLVLLKEITQQLCQDLSLAKTLPVRNTSVSGSFSIFSFLKWIMSFVYWRRKARQCRYMFGMSAHNIGLLVLLDKGIRVRRWRSISSTKV